MNTYLPAHVRVPDNLWDPQANYPLLERIGLTILEQGDLWLHVALPEGWQIHPTSPDRTLVVDQHQHTRLLLTDLTTPGARRTDIITALSVQTKEEPHRFYTAHIILGNESIRHFGPYTTVSSHESPWEAERRATNEAKAWLDENFPAWHDPLAYWDQMKDKQP